MAELIRSYDWTATALGPIETWPQSLVTSVNIVLQSPVPIVMLWGVDGVMLYNDAYSVFAANRHPQLLGSIVVEGWPEVADFNRNVMRTVREKGQTLEYKDQQLTLYRNDTPEEVSMDLTYSPIIAEEGKPEGVLAIVLETTQRVQAEKRQKQAEARLYNERERLRSIFMQAPAPIAILRGPDHVFELANPLYVRLVDRENIEGKSVREAIPEVIEQGFITILDTVYQTAKPFFGNEVPITLQTSQGGTTQRYLNFVYQPSFDTDQNVDGILVHAVDITEQVESRRKVEEIANLNSTITTNATTGLMIMDENHFTTYMNPAAEKITGYSFEEIKAEHKTLHSIVHYKHPDGSKYDIADCPTSKALDARSQVVSEDFFVRKDGSTYPVAIMSSPIIRDGKMVGIVEEIRDISDEKQAEAEIRQLNRELEQRVEERTKELTAVNKELNRSNEELQDFAYVASHDLQEPLRKIAAFSNLLEEDYGAVLPDDAHKYLDGLQKSSGRMRTLINDLLTYSRVTTQTRPFQEIKVKDLVAEVLDDLQSRIDDTKATVTVKTLPTVEADPLQLRLLLQNLISNALKYTSPGVRPKISVTGSTSDGKVEVKVSDNGIGFDEQYLDRIFTIFQRLHGKNEYEGTGVGLAICKKIVERHGGTITATSKAGKGSTFIVSLPRKQTRNV